MNKKGQNLSMNVIIIAAVAMLVLVILVVLVLKSGGKVSDSNKCEGPVYNGQCSIRVPGGSSCGDGYIVNPAATGCGENEVCCVKITSNS
jgi:hypothetical protein